MQNMMDECDLLEESYVTVIHGQGGKGSLNVVTTKVPPGFDGRTLWFAYEEALTRGITSRSSTQQREAQRSSPVWKEKPRYTNQCWSETTYSARMMELSISNVRCGRTL